jgi:hypothetical protein
MENRLKAKLFVVGDVAPNWLHVSTSDIASPDLPGTVRDPSHTHSLHHEHDQCKLHHVNSIGGILGPKWCLMSAADRLQTKRGSVIGTRAAGRPTPSPHSIGPRRCRQRHPGTGVRPTSFSVEATLV